MVYDRLLLSKPGLNSLKIGLPSLARWVSASFHSDWGAGKTSQSKISDASKSSTNRHMETCSGRNLKPSEVEEIFGRSLELSPQSPFGTNKEEIEFPNVPDQNKVLVRFLPKNATHGDITSAFKDCGAVVKVLELPSAKESKFKDAYLCFKTWEGMRKALDKIDVQIKHSDVIVEAVFPFESLARKISIPDLIGIPDAPIALVKNPTCTVMVKKSTHGIDSCHLKEAFALRGSQISSCFFGPSSSVAFVEFETEDAKERAIAERSVSVLGKRLLVYRLDAPRTTVVRMSNVKLNPLSRVECILRPFGQIKHVIQKSSDIVDVHFMISEWPNMLSILNRLNGMEVDRNRWVARPAPCYPPQIVRALWSQPDERERLKGLMRNLSRQLEEKPLSVTTLNSLVAKCYRDLI